MYAALSQEVSLVPIVESEVLMDWTTQDRQRDVGKLGVEQTTEETPIP